MKNIENFEIPENVGYILHILEENGYEGYAVGGCVRDMLLGRTPGDWDITTSAKPEQVKALRTGELSDHCRELMRTALEREA